MSNLDLSILDLSTLDRIKRDAIKVARDYTQPTANVIEAREWVHAIDRELDRRIQWATDVQTALASL